MKCALKSFAQLGFVFAILTTAVYAETYIVHSGDTLSGVAARNLPGPIWGPRGSVQKIIRLNPQIAHSPNLIFPNQKINLPSRQLLGLVGVSKTQRIPASTSASRPVTDEAATALAPAANSPMFTGSPSRFEVSPLYQFSTFHLQDKTTSVSSSLATQIDANIGLRYFQNWTETSRSFESFSIGVLSIEPPQSDSFTIVSSTKVLTSFGLGGSFQLSERLNLEPSINYSSELFARSITTQAATMDVVMIPDVDLKLSYDFFKTSPFTLGFSTNGEYLTPASADFYHIESGYLFGCDLYLKQNFHSGKMFTVDIGFQSRMQNSSLATQKENSILVGATFSSPWGNE